MRSYRAIIERFIQEFDDGPIDQITPEQILTFLNRLTEGNKSYTKRIRFSQLSSFFNFVRKTLKDALEQVERIVRAPDNVFVDMGYHDHGYTGEVNFNEDKRRRGRTAMDPKGWTT